MAAAIVWSATAVAAPTVVADRQCYAADRDVMAVSGNGYTLGGEVALFFTATGGLMQASVTAGSDGAFSTRLIAPTLAEFHALSPGFALTITANDRARQGSAPAPGAPTEPTVAATSVQISEWSVDVPPWKMSRYAKPRRMTTVSAYGWTTLGTTLFAHYVRAHRLVRTVELGQLTGPCGSLTRRMPEFPFRPVRSGTYRVQFDTSRSLHLRGEPYIYYQRVHVRAKDAIR